jgi:hypothetical protein
MYTAQGWAGKKFVTSDKFKSTAAKLVSQPTHLGDRD